MKKIMILLAMLILFFSMTTTGWCLFIKNTTTDVGDVDQYLDGILKTDFSATYGGNSEDNEELWVKDVLSSMGLTAEWNLKIDPAPYYLTDDPSDEVYAFELDPTPPVSEYFLLKNSQGFALYSNNVEYSWGVFDLGDLPEDIAAAIKLGTDTFEISHVLRLDGAPVPEPATMLLLSVGLVGIAGASRKKWMKKS